MMKIIQEVDTNAAYETYYLGLEMCIRDRMLGVGYRVIAQPRIPMYAGCLSFLLNIALNYMGNFFGMLPEEMRNSRLYGVELDPVSGRIAKMCIRDRPEGVYCYDLRGSDYDPGEPVCVEEQVVVNHAGSVLLLSLIHISLYLKLKKQQLACY